MPLTQFPFVPAVVPAIVMASCILSACQLEPPGMPAGDRGPVSAVAGANAGAGVADASASPAPMQKTASEADATTYSSDGPCTEGDRVRIWATPLAPRPGEPLEIIAVATDAALGQLLVTGPDGE
ncbi:MAG: hypothetical protein WBM40_14810, partial [Thiohalocapsa sp.]